MRLRRVFCFVAGGACEAPRTTRRYGAANGLDHRLDLVHAAAVEEKDSAKRVEMYGDIQRKVRDHSAFVLMFQQARQDAMRANVSGFYAGGATDSASYWTVTK